MAIIEPSLYEGHRFNDDLLTNPGDIGRAKEHFPGIMHVLDDPYLREIFVPHDQAAKATKAKSQFRGVVAIGMGAFAMLIAAATELYPAEPVSVRSLGIISLVLGFGSVVVGWFGVLHGKSKRDWLCRRVITERLRQSHFQAFCCRWPAISSSLHGKAAEEEYRALRQTWLDPIRDQLTLHAGAELTEFLDDESETKCWLHPGVATLPEHEASDLAGPLISQAELRIHSMLPPERAGEGLTELSEVYRELWMQSTITRDDYFSKLDQVFAAYRELRIMHQLHYANYKLRDEYSILSWPLRMQAVRLSFILLLCTLVFFLVHCAIAGSLMWYGAKEPFVHYLDLAVIWVAILALAAHAFQEGLQPEREILRYRNYRAAIRAIRDRFDEASSYSAKIEIMREMEQLSFDEFRNFLRSVHEARFIF